MLSVFYTVLVLAIFIFVMLGGFIFFLEIEQVIGQAQVEDIIAYTPALILISLISNTFHIFIMATWFAPTIKISSEETALLAMLLSFNACLKNLLPFILYGIVVFILSIIAAIPLMLCYLVLIPVVSASLYVSYLSCFKSDVGDDPIQL